MLSNVLGFSLGGLLACSIAAKLWILPFFSADILLQNVACIMFGPPYVNFSYPLPHLEEAIHQFPDILQSFYSFHLRDDIIPKFYLFADESIIQQCMKEQVCGVRDCL